MIFGMVKIYSRLYHDYYYIISVKDKEIGLINVKDVDFEKS
jgi:hypothetical protein